MKRRKCNCELIPVSVYEGTPPVEFEDNTHKYFKSTRGKAYYRKVNRKTCNICSKTAEYLTMFKYARHNRVERFCRDHAQQFSDGELPNAAEIEIKAQKSLII
jgi:hypothetical protein